jgi:L-malate glycosyltransferase
MRLLVLARANYVLAARRVDLYKEEGHTVKLLSFHTRGALTEVQHLGYSGPMSVSFLTAVPAVRREIERFKPDLIDAHGATSYGFLAALAAGRRPWMLTLYGTDVYDHAGSNKLLAHMASLALRRANLIYGSSPYVLDAAQNLSASVRADKCIFLPWGIPLGDPVSTTVVTNVRNQLGTPESAFVAIHPRRLSEHWRLDWILGGLQQLGSHIGRAVELWLAYPPPTKAEQQLLDDLEHRAAGEMVTIRKLGQLPYRTLMEHLASADVFVCAARQEMLANSFLESLYYGAVPVVARLMPFEQASQWDDVHFELFDPDDPKEFLAALLRIANYDEGTILRINAGNALAVRRNASERDCLTQLLHAAGEMLFRAHCP